MANYLNKIHCLLRITGQLWEVVSRGGEYSTHRLFGLLCHTSVTQDFMLTLDIRQGNSRHCKFLKYRYCYEMTNRFIFKCAVLLVTCGRWSPKGDWLQKCKSKRITKQPAFIYICRNIFEGLVLKATCTVLLLLLSRAVEMLFSLSLHLKWAPNIAVYLLSSVASAEINNQLQSIVRVYR